MPTGSNPTNLALSDCRRKELAQLIKKRNLIAVEDDNYAALMKERCLPLTLEVPENCIFISGLSKPLCPGLRIAYLYVPPHLMADMERAIFSHNLKISSLNIEIAAELIHRRVGVFGAERFSVGNQANNNAIRIATCSPESAQELCQGLEIIRQFIKEQASDCATFIV